MGKGTSARVAWVAPLLTIVFAAAAHGQEGMVPVGSEFEITRFATETHLRNVCTTPTGGFLVVRSQGALKKSNVLVKRFDNRGNAIAPDFGVNTYVGGYAVEPDVACGPGGGFLVVWTDRVPLNVERDGVLDDDVFARGFNSDGEVLGPPFRVNQFLEGNQNSPAVCAQGDARFAIVWQDRRRSEIDSRVVSRVETLTAEQRVAEDPRATVPPRVACANDGRYLTVWTEFPSKSANDEVAARLSAANGTPTAPQFFVNSDPSGDQNYPVVCHSPSDDFIVAWRDARSTPGDGTIRARHVDVDGAVDGPDFQVSARGRTPARIACAANNLFVTTTRDGDDFSETLFARAAAQRSRIGGEAIVHEGRASLEPAPPAVSHDDDRQFVVVWPDSVAGSQSLRGQFFEVVGGASPTTTSTTLMMGDEVCGDAVEDGVPGSVTVLDALAVLRGSVGTGPCEPCRCDVDSSGAVTVQDALLVLSFVADLPVVLDCPPCT